MTGPVYVVDTGPLSHFASTQWLGVLKRLLAGGRVVIPDTVERELLTGVAGREYLKSIIEADWIDVVSVEGPEQLAAWCRDPKNPGPPLRRDPRGTADRSAGLGPR